MPNIKGGNQRGIFFVRNYTDGLKINDSDIIDKAQSCIIAGAGLVGLEMVEAFKKRRLPERSRGSVAIVEMADHILPFLNESRK